MTPALAQVLEEMDRALEDQHFYPVPQRVDLIDLQAWRATIEREVAAMEAEIEAAKNEAATRRERKVLCEQLEADNKRLREAMLEAARELDEDGDRTCVNYYAARLREEVGR